MSVPPFTDPRIVVGMAAKAEESGWDGFFLWDHLRWDGKQDVHDPWVLLGAVAQATERITLGTLVTPLSRRRPHVVAKHVMTLDHLSGGRAVLGVGLGDPPDLDFGDFGDEPDPRTRGAILDEALAIVGDLLGPGTTDRSGPHLRAAASVKPLPVQRPRVPIWVAGRAPNRRPLERARQWDGYAPIASGFQSPEEIAAYVGPAPRDGWELVVPWEPGVDPAAYEAAGATWLTVSAWPHEEGWLGELQAMAAAGPLG